MSVTVELDEKTKQAKVKARAWIYVATPCYTNKVDAECVKSMMVATQLGLLRGVILDWQFIQGCSLVQYARNWLVGDFLVRPEYTHLMWLDDDLGFEPDAIMKLFEADKDVIGGVYTNKADKPVYVYQAHAEPEGFIQECDRLPGGFLLLKRKAVEDIAQRCEEFCMPHNGKEYEVPHMFDLKWIEHQEKPGKYQLLGEDYCFSELVSECGYKLYARTDIGFNHMGIKAWSSKLSNSLREYEATGGLPVVGAGHVLHDDKTAPHLDKPTIERHANG